jgi:hypothetical protein
VNGRAIAALRETGSGWLDALYKVVKVLRHIQLFSVLLCYLLIILSLALGLETLRPWDPARGQE